MKKGITATAVLALAIGIMTVIFSIQLCNWMPSMQAACWVQQHVQGQHEEMLIHYSGINTRFDHIREQEGGDEARHEVLAGFGVPTEGKTDCELGKQAAYALGNGEEATVLPSLETIALHANCLEVRKAAVHTIEGFGSEAAREALIRILLATTG